MRSLVLLLFVLLCSAAQASLGVSIQKYADAPCGEAVGAMVAQPSGGTPPYTIAWSNGATTDYIEWLAPGSYTVTVTDALGAVATASEDILTLAAFPQEMMNPSSYASCPEEYPYAVLYLEGGHHGVSPHAINGPNLVQAAYVTDAMGYYYHYLWFLEPPGTTLVVDWTDANGCPGSSEVQVSSELQWPTVQDLSAIGACNGSNGSIHASFLMPSQEQLGFRLRRMDGTPVGSAPDQISNSTSPFGWTWNNLAAGDYWVIIDPDAMDAVPLESGMPMACADSFFVNVPDMSGNCGQVTGTAYFDQDQDCTQDPPDHGVPCRVIEILPGPYYAYTNGNGHYSRNIANGTYSIGLQGTGSELFPLCPNTSTVNVTVNGGAVVQNFADSSLLDLDLEARIHGSAARPGFQQDIWMEVRNNSARVSGAFDVVLEIDPQFTFVSASTAPTSVVGNTVTWSGLAALSAFQTQGLSVVAQVPADVSLIGQPYVYTMNVSQAVTEATLANNTATAGGTITGSFDPNEKTVRTSTGLSDAAYFIEQDEWMEYTVGFQNTGNDTAFTVVVRDTLSASLDLSTYEQGITSHPYTITFLPNNVVEWRFADILLPDSNVNEALSHGQVNFRIRPKQPAVPGTIITNAASIYFDFNPPIRTNDAVLVLENSTGIAEQATSDLKLAPNPATDRVQVFGAVAPGLRYTLIAADGRTMATGALNADRSIPVAALAAGLYTVRFAVNGEAPVLRFLKY